MGQVVPYEALRSRRAPIAPKNLVFWSYELKERTRDETTAIRIREVIPARAQGLRLTVRAPFASQVHTWMLAKTE